MITPTQPLAPATAQWHLRAAAARGDIGGIRAALACLETLPPIQARPLDWLASASTDAIANSQLAAAEYIAQARAARNGEPVAWVAVKAALALVRDALATGRALAPALAVWAWALERLGPQLRAACEARALDSLDPRPQRDALAVVSGDWRHASTFDTWRGFIRPTGPESWEAVGWLAVPDTWRAPAVRLDKHPPFDRPRPRPRFSFRVELEGLAWEAPARFWARQDVSEIWTGRRVAP